MEQNTAYISLQFYTIMRLLPFLATIPVLSIVSLDLLPVPGVHASPVDVRGFRGDNRRDMCQVGTVQHDDIC